MYVNYTVELLNSVHIGALLFETLFSLQREGIEYFKRLYTYTEDNLFKVSITTDNTAIQTKSYLTQSQQGSPPALAQMPWKMGLMAGQAAGEPPGMREGP